MNMSRSNGNGTTQACAACKYQRRKCAPDCILAPYFPHDCQRQFLNAHKLFGVSNITKIIKHLDPQDKHQAMRTIIYQSDMRASDPVWGCYRVIQELQAQIEYHRAELELVLQQLAIFRAQAHAYNATMNGNEIINADPLNLSPPHYHSLQQVPPQQDHQQYINIVQENNTTNNSSTSLQEVDLHSWAMQDSMSLSSLSLQGQNGNSSGDEYDHKPMLEIPSDERNDLRFEPEEFVDSSDEVILFKIGNAGVNAESEYIQQAQDHDLKGAATLFTLTNYTS